MLIQLIILSSIFASSKATDALLYWNLTCHGPQIAVRFQWNCHEKTDKDDVWVSENAPKDAIICDDWKDMLKALQEGENANLVVKMGIEGRYLTTNRYRLIEGLKPDYTTRHIAFKPGFNVDTTSLKTCTLTYFIYKDFDKFEQKLVDLVSQPTTSEVLENKVLDFANFLIDDLKKAMPKV